MRSSSKSEPIYRFSAYDTQEAARRLRSMNDISQVDLEVSEPEPVSTKRRLLDRLSALQRSIARRIGAPRVTITNSRPFYSLLLMTGSILQGIFPLNFIGRAARSTIRWMRDSYSSRSSRRYRDSGVQTEDETLLDSVREQGNKASSCGNQEN